MPAALRRYWAGKRRGRKGGLKGRRKLAFGKGRRGWRKRKGRWVQTRGHRRGHRKMTAKQLRYFGKGRKGGRKGRRKLRWSKGRKRWLFPAERKGRKGRRRRKHRFIGPRRLTSKQLAAGFGGKGQGGKSGSADTPYLQQLRRRRDAMRAFSGGNSEEADAARFS